MRKHDRRDRVAYKCILDFSGRNSERNMKLDTVALKQLYKYIATVLYQE